MSAGHHTHEMIAVLSAQRCDGLTTDEAASCALAGELSLFQRAADVTTPEIVNGGWRLTSHGARRVPNLKSVTNCTDQPTPVRP